MSYLVLARKYRPQTFDEVYAQEHITKVLRNTIELDRTAHAYLFTGPRGVGKTSMARIFAKSLNCLENGPTITPCNKCQNCVEIKQGNSSDVIEIDGASNTGVNDIRDLQKELMYSPSNSNYKIYIIDEVHMLSKSAFNALLKTLEEPPERVIFIFATTEPHKVLPTIISRCQRFDFRRIPIESIISRLKDICQKEKITADDESLFLIAKKADGSMRDAQSLMDQILAYGKEKINHSDVLSIFGIVPDDIFAGIMENIANKNAGKLIDYLHKIVEKGNDLEEFINGLLEFVRNLLLLKIGLEIKVFSQSQQNKMEEIHSKFSENDLLYLIQLLIKTKTDLKNSDNPILIIEMAFVKISRLKELEPLEKIFQELDKNPSTEELIEKDRIKEKDHSPKLAKQIIRETKPKNQRKKVENITQEVWEDSKNELSARMKASDMILANYFLGSKLQQITNNTITLSVQSQLAFDILESKQNFIEHEVSDFFQTKVHLIFKLIKKQNKKIINNPNLEDIKKESPVVAEFIEKTDSVIE